MRIGHRAALAALFLFSAAFPPAASGEGAADGTALLRRVAAKYSSVKTLSARFRQEVPLMNVGVVRKASGQVYFQRPLRMRWDYRAPGEQLFLADGRYFYFRPPGSPQVYRRKIDEKTIGGKIPLLLLFGGGDITEYFRVEEMTPLKGGQETALRLVPKGDGAPEVKRVDLVVDDSGLAIRQIHLYDRLGGSNHLYFDDIVIDPSLPADLFRFRKPPEIEVVDG
ncbi:MAG: outer membrane lipoprotein carrier protein LolA [Deltaproteobacteria bacterium]|nr:outer membrane lipoprotein carrier protein LolA [Deltaproteobacteria bacterium]